MDADGFEAQGKQFRRLDSADRLDAATLALEGQEISDDAARRMELLDEVNDLIMQSPDDAAATVSRWLTM